MTSETNVPCGLCRFDNLTKEAKRWCTNCEEGLCEDCEKAHKKNEKSRNHQVISIQDYRKIENISISQVCEHHGENLEWFCETHDEVLCMVCVPTEHKACSDVISISVATAKSRQSTALSDLERTIEGTLHDVKQCIMNRKSAAENIDKQELAIKTTILETRTKINSQLDKMQENMLHDLRSTSHNCKSKYAKFCQKLDSEKKILTKLREQTKHMKQFYSDIHVFLGTRQVNRQIVSEIGSIKSEVGCVTLPNGNLLIANGTNEITEYSDKGEHIRDIPVSGRPFDITVKDSNRIGMTYGDLKYLEIMNSNNFNSENKISLQNCCFGLSAEDGKLYVISEDATIKVLDLSGVQLQILKIESNKPYYITASSNRIIYTNWEKKSVHCCSLKGKELWQFKHPGGVAVDNYNNVYVVGYYYDYLITIIQHDGKDSKVLLTKSDGLDLPITLYFDKKKNSLLICNLRGKVAL
ncbi:unnamed protein product [Mytilus edulis]|uniref:B box-type domain-containing protein n=1 Tax=Mytilus edulis TaxID=6550 RepID=A0A8S3SZH0_MYTED|nr:unnamed protein product [Mytilus edulis]